MSYNQKGVKQTYRQHPRVMRHSLISPSHHLTFRNEWETNLEVAIAKANALKSQGYLVDEALERGALTQSQATRLINRLKELGCEAETIPIANWAGEKVVFVVYKPPKEPVKPEKPPETVKPKTKPPPSPEQLANKFIKDFFGAHDATDELNKFKSEGYMLDPHRKVALIRQDAPSTVSLAKQVKAFTEPLATIPKPSYFAKGLSSLKPQGYRYVRFADSTGELDLVRKALRFFGSGEVKVHSQGKEQPIYFVDQWGNAIAIAPVLEENISPAQVLAYPKLSTPKV